MKLCVRLDYHHGSETSMLFNVLLSNPDKISKSCVEKMFFGKQHMLNDSILQIRPE
jgi:hypothetical protein